MTKPAQDMTLGEYMYTVYVKYQWQQNGLWCRCWDDLHQTEKNVWESLAAKYPDVRDEFEIYG